MTTNIAYIAIDLHTHHSVIGHMNEAGHYVEQHRFPTTRTQLISQVVGIAAETKYLTLEQSNMSHWAAGLLQPYVEQLTVCDPRHNRLICGELCKNDSLDTMRLCELLRLDSLKSTYSGQQMGERRLFYHQIKEYERLKKKLTIAKRQLHSSLSHWGYHRVMQQGSYSHPETILARIAERGLRDELEAKWEEIAFLAKHKANQLRRVEATGRAYWEIAEFMRMPGLGTVGAHTFSAYIQTPHRFARKAQLWRYSCLGVRHHSSDGYQVRGAKLNKDGHTSLKNLSHTAWYHAMRSDNEIRRFYEASLQNCGGNDTHARLNTQRKILNSLWSIWKHNQTYDPSRIDPATRGCPDRLA